MKFLEKATSAVTQQTRVTSRTLFTQPHVVPTYDNTLKSIPFVASNLKYYQNTTFRGKLIGNDFLQAVWAESGINIGYRGMAKKEFAKEQSAAMLGLIGKKELIVLNPDGTRNEKATLDNLAAHAESSSTVHGISVSDRIRVGFKFAGFLIPSSKTVLVVDYNNIPNDQIFSPAELVVQRGQSYNIEGNPVVYTKEWEKTVTHVPGWAGLLKITRSGLELNVELNPLYVDQAILSPDLKAEFDNLSSEFYRVERICREDINHPDVTAYQEKVRNFYNKYAIEAKLGDNHVKAIASNLENFKIDMTDEKKVEADNINPQTKI